MRMLLLLLNVACYPEFPTTKGESFPENPWHDYDGDGYTEMSGDCDDEVPGIPAPVTYYLDGDNDTFGDASESYTACINMMPAGYVADGTDCNDTDPETYPGSSRDGAGLCVRDLDGDDYGDATATDPYDKGSDCNDDDALTYPGSSQEGSGLCVQDLDGDGYGGRNVALPYDQGSDCDDSDERTFPGSSREGGGLCVQDLDGDGYGDSQQPEGFDSGWDCNDADSTVFPGSSLEAGNLCVRDLDGDGYGDQAVELPYDAGTDCNDSHEDVHLGSRGHSPFVKAFGANFCALYHLRPLQYDDTE